MKGVPYLNPNPYCWFMSPKNLGEALIDGELDIGLNSISSLPPTPISGEWTLCL